MNVFSIIIPTLNRAEFLRDALISLIFQSVSYHDFEILVIDNGSTDNTEKIAKEAIATYSKYNIRYIYEPEPGLLSGRHRGALESQGNILIFIDDDIEADKNWLQAIKQSFQDPKIQLVGGRNLPKYQINPPKWLEWFWTENDYGKSCSYLSLLDFGNTVREIDANYIWGLNFSIRRQALFDLGGFHPDIVPNHLQHFQGDGETGLTLKANQANYKAIYQPDALVFHQIPKERMTHEYFIKRCFFTGVCNSFTEIRKTGSLTPLNWKATTYKFFKKIKYEILPLTRKLSEEKAVKLQLHKARLKGYKYHRQIVQQNHQLLEWICRPNYWNYQLPTFNILS